MSGRRANDPRKNSREGTLGNILEELTDKLEVGDVMPVAGLGIPPHDSITNTYTGDNLTGVVYKLAGVTVATLTLAYTGSNLTSVTKT